jgi:hypothetical protein
MHRQEGGCEPMSNLVELKPCKDHAWVFSSCDEFGWRYRCSICGELQEFEQEMETP